MNGDQQKAREFLVRLWDNPSLQGLSPLQKEEQLQQFLKINGPRLQPTLTSPAFFPGKPWPWVQSLMSHTLSDMANQSLGPLYERILDSKLDFTFVSHLQQRVGTPQSMRTSISAFIKDLSSNPDARKALTGPLIAVAGGMVDKYTERVFERQKYISFELRKVQRLRLNAAEVANLVKASMLLRPAVQRYSPPGAAPGLGNNPITVTPAFANSVLEKVKAPLAVFPEALLRSAINSALSFQENPYIESSARLSAIFAQRCRNMKPGMKVDRGAESSDKSWFNVARKNYKYYGFDLDMLVELHSIAAENGW